MNHKPSCAIYNSKTGLYEAGALTDYQQGFQAGAASRDAEVAELVAALKKIADETVEGSTFRHAKNAIAKVRNQ